MRRALALFVPAVAAVCLLAGGAGADADPVVEAKLAANDGKFREADGLIERAPPEIQNDPAVHKSLGDLAMRYVAQQEGEKKRDGLFSARQHYAKLVELSAADAAGAAGVLKAARALADLDLEAKHVEDARAEAKFALESAEKASAAGVATPEFKALLGRMYGLRASFSKSMKDVDQIVSDSTKGATLLAEAAVGSEDAGKLLSEASAIRLRAAGLVHEGVPPENEKHKLGDEALAAAIDLATKACAIKGANESDYRAHLDALRLAHAWGLKGMPKPFMQPLTPPFSPLKLEIPRASGWTRDKADGWDLVLKRNLHDEKNDGSMQVFFRGVKASDAALGGRWAALGDMSVRQMEKDKAEFSSVSSSSDAAQLMSGKSPVEVWSYQVAGQDAKSNRLRRLAAFYFFADKKKEQVVQLKINDWRPVPDVEEPDVVAFVASAIGEGLWPPGAAQGKPADEPKKPKKK
jgi:hypothetical protein